jgi:hypothetical protein
MIDITTMTPIVVATGLSFCFKNTRGIGIVGVAVMSYFAPVLFLILGTVSLLAFTTYKLGEKR